MLIHVLVTAACAMAITLWRLHSGLALIGDSGSYLAGASGLSEGRLFDTPLVPSFSELSLLDTVHNAGWSPFADFGIGLPIVIALVNFVLPLTTAAAAVTIASIGLITSGVVIGPSSPRRHSELWMRSVLAVALSCWPILRFTAGGVLSEPLFCAALVWLAVLVVRLRPQRMLSLVVLGALTVTIGLLRFVGPVAALVVAVLLVQRGLSRRRAAVWAVITAIGPTLATLIATGSTGARVFALHGLNETDVFFTARGLGGWLEANFGDQTTTLLRSRFQPTIIDWLITIIGIIAAVAVLAAWARSIRRRRTSELEPALVLAVALALAVIPSMVVLDAVLKLENRILMPSGILVISAAGWWLAQRRVTAVSWSVVCLWVVVATHPWQWFDRLDAPEPTVLTDVVGSMRPAYVITNRADLVWWITRIPARYVPDGYHDLSDRTYDPTPIMRALPCALHETDGAVIIESGTVNSAVTRQLDADVEAGRYEMTTSDGVVAYEPTGIGC